MIKQWFKLRGNLDEQSSWVFTILGLLITITFWWILAELFSANKPIVENYHSILPSSLDSMQTESRDSILKLDSINYISATKFEKVYPILPRPDKVLFAFKDLYVKDKLILNTTHSVWLNIQGYFWAIFLAIPIGFIIGLFPVFKGLFSKQVDALRYLPLSALTGLFIIWFGLGDLMKIGFLTVGILVYLIPVVVQRISEVEDVYAQTAFTLGASKFQQIKHVFFPAVMSKLIDDIRVLTAISWTYIIIAELLNKESGIGSLIYTKARQGQIDRVFALLVVITLIGLLQDKIFGWIDRILHPYKYTSMELPGTFEAKLGVFIILGSICLGLVSTNSLGLSFLLNVAITLSVIGFLIILYSYFKLKQA